MQNIEKTQKVIITDRKRVDIESAECVTLLDDDRISLDTTCGTVVIEGEDLKLENLEKTSGLVTVTGKICGLFYVEKQKKSRGRSIFK